MQPATIMPGEQKANINAILAGRDKTGAVCNECLGQCVNRSKNVITVKDKVVSIDGYRRAAVRLPQPCFSDRLNLSL